MKAFIIFVLVLLILLGSGVGWWGMRKMNKIEPRGAGLQVEKEFPAEDIERLTERYNLILDREDVLMPVLKKHGLKDYYKVSSSEDALEQFREDTFVRLPGGRDLHVLFNGKRKTRSLRDAVASDLAKNFIAMTQTMDLKN